MNARKIYISGKISGLTPQQAEANFRLAERRLMTAPPYYRYIVNPLNIRPLFGINSWITFMIADIFQLIFCDEFICYLTGRTVKGLELSIKLLSFLGLIFITNNNYFYV